MVSCSRCIWITNSNELENLNSESLAYKHGIIIQSSYPNHLRVRRPSGLGNYFIFKRFAVQSLLWLLQFVIKINLEHDTIAVWNLVRSWSISTLTSSTFNFLKNLFSHIFSYKVLQRLYFALSISHICLHFNIGFSSLRFKFPRHLYITIFVRFDSQAFFFKSHIKIVTTFTTFSNFESSLIIILL